MHHSSVATNYNNIGLVWQSLSIYDKSLESYEYSLAIRLKTLGENHPDVASSYYNLSGVWKLKGNNDKALEFLIKSI